ncbi:hypothetical protein niasHT_011429 [Heterodera trifolii]|uniref:Uncharacterized protein n=1 Tax=Heterodera trifolii TaxID=157864 RepID=A0ABD2L321_9BILA
MTVIVFLLFLIAPICQLALADLKESVPGVPVRENGNLTKKKVLQNEKTIPALKKTSPKSSKHKDDDLLSQALIHLRKLNEQTKNGSWSENSDETLTTLYLLLEIETKLTKFDEKATKTIQELNKNLMSNTKNKLISESQSLKELSEEMSKTINTMKNNEDKAAKVNIDGVNGTLAQILSKANVHKNSIRLQIYVEMMKLLKLIHERMEQSPEKDTIGKVIGKSTVANSGKTVMPSQLMGLMRELWIHFLQRIRRTDQNKANQTNPKIKQNEVIPNKQKHALSNKQKQEKPKQLVPLGDKFRRRRRSPLPIVIIRSLSLALAILCITVIALEHHNPWAVVVIALLALYSQQENNRNFPTQIADVTGNIVNRICGTRHTEGDPFLNGHRNNYGHESHRNIPQTDVPQAYSSGNYVQHDWRNLAPQANELYAPVRNANLSGSGNPARRSSNDNNGRAAASGSVRQRLITPDLTLEIDYRAPANRNNNQNNSRPGVESSRSRRPNRLATNSLASSGNTQQNERTASIISERSGEEKDDNNSIRSKCTACKLVNSSSSSSSSDKRNAKAAEKNEDSDDHDDDLGESDDENEDKKDSVDEDDGKKDSVDDRKDCDNGDDGDADDDDDDNDDYNDDKNVSNDKEALSNGSNSSSEPSVIVISSEYVETNEINNAEMIKENLPNNQSYYAESVGRKEDAGDEDDDDDDELDDDEYEDDDHDHDKEEKKERENDSDAHSAESSDESREKTDNEDNATDDEEGEKERKTVGGVGKD